jgi:PAS domain-containing protein
MLVVMRVLETLGRAFTGSLVGMGLLDLDGRWLEVNPALCRLLGRDADGLLGHSLLEVTHPDDVGMSVAARRCWPAAPARSRPSRSAICAATAASCGRA